jgi:hypothetical protein
MASLMLAGCADDLDEDGMAACPAGFSGEPDTGCDVDVFAVGELVADVGEGTFFEAANSEPFTQQHGPPKSRIVFGSTNLLRLVGGGIVSAVEIYRTIDPTDLEAEIAWTVPMGTMFVHYTPEGPPWGAMVKQAPGTDPDNNDWFFGRFDEQGYPQPIESYDGQTCRDCHVLDARPERTDMLWGVPRAALGT